MEKITLGLAGDVMIGRLVNEHLKDAPPASVWGDLLPLLKSADFTLINLEAALTRSEKAVPKVFNFKSDPKNVQVLREAGIACVNLANNHVLDYGIEGLLETLKTLDEASVRHVGAGADWGQAIEPTLFDCQGVSIGVLGCTDNEPTWKAGASKPGTFYLEVGEDKEIERAVKALRPHVDLLIVSIHWGPNMQERPPLHFQDFAHHLIDLGVDLLHGHSAHIFQGIEVYRNKVILYDTGDFVDDYAIDPLLRNDCSFLFLIEASKQGLQGMHLIPTRISDFQVNQVKDEESLSRMKNLSKELGTTLQEQKNTLHYSLLSSD